MTDLIAGEDLNPGDLIEIGVSGKAYRYDRPNSGNVVLGYLTQAVARGAVVPKDRVAISVVVGDICPPEPARRETWRDRPPML